MMAALAVPTDSSALVRAGQWSVDLLSGSLATGIAVIAIAGIGFLMLTGRIEMRRAATVVVGCFLLFGAGSIASALSNLAQAQGASTDRVARYTPTPIRAARPSKPAQSYDPYAGASLIDSRRRQ